MAIVITFGAQMHTNAIQCWLKDFNVNNINFFYQVVIGSFCRLLRQHERSEKIGKSHFSSRINITWRIDLSKTNFWCYSAENICLWAFSCTNHRYWISGRSEHQIIIVKKLMFVYILFKTFMGWKKDAKLFPLRQLV